MSRKHFVMLAALLAEHRAHHESNESPASAAAIDALTHDLARELKAFNSAFDRGRFLRAAGAPEGGMW